MSLQKKKALVYKSQEGSLEGRNLSASILGLRTVRKVMFNEAKGLCKASRSCGRVLVRRGLK